MRALTSWRETAGNPAEFAVALRWVIEDGPFPPYRTTGRATLDVNAAGELVLHANEAPPSDALVANEATGRDGVAVAYVMAFVDGNSNGLLDCRNPGDCDDVQIGASPNSIVVYAEEAWPAEAAPLFGFNGTEGVRPVAGWSLVYLQFEGTVARPIARPWSASDAIELVIIGDFRERDREERRSVQPDVD